MFFGSMKSHFGVYCGGPDHMLLSHTLCPHNPGSGLSAEKAKTKKKVPALKEVTVKG